MITIQHVILWLNRSLQCCVNGEYGIDGFEIKHITSIRFYGIN